MWVFFLFYCFFFLFFLFFFFFFFFLLLPGFSVVLSVFDWGFMNFKFVFFFNNLLFSFILFLVSTCVLIFSTYYLNSEINFMYYCFVLLIFVGSMFSLIYSNGFFSMLVSWDLLGISSFFLVLFYKNWDSISGSMNTALTNRVGDFFLFIFFCSGIFSGCFFFSASFFCEMFLFFLIFTGFTKSAQFPFSSWLPKAMSAPTPVSSLVHSSTLVTAGLILIMNYNILIMDNMIISFILFIGVITMFFSSVSALVEEDMKKVVALSTLSQMGFSTVTVGLGLWFVSFIHLISHALFKSCLFMQVGYIIHCSYGQQDSRYYNNNGNYFGFLQFQLLMTLFCLCGLFFSSGMVSKDMVLEFFFFNYYSMMFSFFFFISVFITFLYSYRLWKGFFLFTSSSVFFYGGSYFFFFTGSVLIIFSVFFIWWLNLNLVSTPSLFMYIDKLVPVYFCLFFFFFMFFLYKLIMKDLYYKVFVDYFNKLFNYIFMDFKYIDFLLNNMGMKIGGVMMLLSGCSNYYMKEKNFNLLIVLIFIMFVLY